MQAPVISFINMKGGVGKTTLCISVGEYLANHKDKKVLIIDIDPQFNATQSFIGKLDLISDYLSLVKEKRTIKKIFEVNSSIYEDDYDLKKEEVILNIYPNLDIIPGDINIMFEHNTVDNTRLIRIRNFIDDNNLKKIYNYILIDCPPTISMYTESSIMASSHYIMPMKIDQYSVLGTSNLLSIISKLAKDQRLSIKPLGVIYTGTSKRLTKKTKEIKNSIETEKGIQELYFFTNHFHNVRDLQVGQQGNFASSYTQSRVMIDAICHEMEQKLSEVNDETKSK
ncbi:CobQ/CobB/MinD/ParA family protein [Xenorhabdus vietnamensis]|uniref:CobQ/CobB/MinD/ParA family protein n=1 Tax=Xenorhabdus vietnamensis TaxID=351656 RepID=A0A1Y2SDN2_9GAMM|nr:ParA family protein [Xenorhabdus vietnamensis]OTA15648.1 CobQ/CobB/MinD/ParA family protein [Xenorhabdus vietnamensis]